MQALKTAFQILQQKALKTSRKSDALPVETCSCLALPFVPPVMSGAFFPHLVCDRLLPAWPSDAQVLLTLVANPHVYTDKASDSVQEASTLQATVAGQDADDGSIPVSHIDGRRRSLSPPRGGSEGQLQWQVRDGSHGGPTSPPLVSKARLPWK